MDIAIKGFIYMDGCGTRIICNGKRREAFIFILKFASDKRSVWTNIHKYQIMLWEMIGKLLFLLLFEYLNIFLLFYSFHYFLWKMGSFMNRNNM